MTMPRRRMLLVAGLFATAVFVAGTILGGCARPVMMPGSADKGYIVYGYVKDAGGNAVEGAHVYLYDDARNELVSTVQTDTFGTYRFAYYPPGEYRLEVGDTSATANLADVDIQVDLVSTEGGSP